MFRSPFETTLPLPNSPPFKGEIHKRNCDIFAFHQDTSAESWALVVCCGQNAEKTRWDPPPEKNIYKT